MIEGEHLCTFGPGRSAPEHTWASPWWPLIALLVGAVVIVVGGILLSP